MAKRRAPATPTTPTHKYCANCGLPVRDALATRAADPTVKFCGECGRKLPKSEKCGNEDCKYFDQPQPASG